MKEEAETLLLKTVLETNRILVKPVELDDFDYLKSPAAATTEKYLLEHSALAQVGEPDMILDEL